jgi:hypothetical protein
MRTELPAVTVTGPAGTVEAAALAASDVAAAGRVRDLRLVPGDDALSADVTLAPSEPAV